MSAARHNKAPLTFELIVRITKRLDSLSMTREEFRQRLNKHLPESRRISDNHSGMVKLYRWLNPTSESWGEPHGEIVLAMQKTYDEIS